MGTRMAHGARANTVIRRESRGPRLSRARARARTLHLWIAAVVLMMAWVCALSFNPASRKELFEKLTECVGDCTTQQSRKVFNVGPAVDICDCCKFTKPENWAQDWVCLLYTSPSPRDATLSRMPSSA